MTSYGSKLATAAIALTFATTAMAAEKTLDIGVSDALTGGAAVYGLPQANAVKMAMTTRRTRRRRQTQSAN